VSGADEGRCSFCLGRFFDDVIGRRLGRDDGSRAEGSDIFDAERGVAP
jgi:hypothetical protein